MPTYPITSMSDGSVLEETQGTVVTRAVSGATRGYAAYPETVYTARIIHRYLSDTDKDSLMNFYDLYKYDDFDFTYPGYSETFTMRFLARPQREFTPGAQWNITVDLEGVAQ